MLAFQTRKDAPRRYLSKVHSAADRERTAVPPESVTRSSRSYVDPDPTGSKTPIALDDLPCLLPYGLKATMAGAGPGSATRLLGSTDVDRDLAATGAGRSVLLCLCRPVQRIAPGLARAETARGDRRCQLG